MSVFKNPYFFLPLLLFAGNQVLEKSLGIFVPWIHAYLDDLMAMPVILGITLQIYRWIHPQKDFFSFKKQQVWVALIYVSLVFEAFLPWVSTDYRSDSWDVVCYAMGAFLFYKKINQPDQRIPKQDFR